MQRLNFWIGPLCLLALLISGCYYDSEEAIYGLDPQTTDCDTLAVSYADFVTPLLASHCTDCHGGTAPSANISLDTYEGVRNAIASGKFVGAVRHDPGFSPMPRNGNKLPDCEIARLVAWVQDGFPNN